MYLFVWSQLSALLGNKLSRNKRCYESDICQI